MVYSLSALPKEWRDPRYANDSHYFLAYEKDNLGFFDEKSNKFYKTGRYVPGLGSRVRRYAPLIVTDNKNRKIKLKQYEIMQSWPDIGIAEIKNTGSTKPTRKTRKRVKT